MREVTAGPSDGPEEGADRSSDVLGPVALSVAIGVVVLFAALVLVAPPTISRDLLTLDGVNNLRPERDTYIYLGAGLISVAATVVLARGTTAWRGGTQSARTLRWLPVVVAGGVIAAATAAFLHVRRALPMSASASRTYLCMSVLVAGACVVVSRLTRRSAEMVPPDRSPPAAAADRRRLGLWDAVVALLVVVFVYVPGWPALAGNAFAGEGSLHLDFFAFGPALAFRSGVALGSELHTYYGLGWPVVLAQLGQLSYAHIIRLEVVYGCVYFIGVYALLRVLVGDRRWAAAGTALAIFLQLFADFPSFLVMWRFPSATVLRWPFDVWFFLACLLHLRTRRTEWIVAAGACVGLAVVFETDTGLALGAAFGFLWICLLRLDGAASLRRFAWSAAAAGSLLVLGLGVASRWTMFSGAFWSGWMENLRLSADGATFLPLTTEPPTRSVLLFVLVAVVYLMVLCFSVAQLAKGRLSMSTAMLGCIALYGFLTLLYFVGRSSPYNLFRPTVPFAILVAAIGGLAHRAWLDARARTRAERGAAGGAAWAASAIAVAMLAAHPGARAYPGLIRSAVTSEPARGICLFDDPDDVCGLPTEAQQLVDDLHALSSRLRALGSADTSVAVLDEIGPVIQSMSGARPWGRYLPVFPGLFTREMVAAVGRDLEERPPALVVMRPRAEDRKFYADMWRELRAPVERGFVLDGREGPFEIWRRR